MSYCTFLATNYPLYDIPPAPGQRLSFEPDHRLPSEANDTQESYLAAFPDVPCYSDMRYGALMDWSWSEASAGKYIRYIETLLKREERVEIWHVWLTDDYREWDERPVVRRCRMPLRDLTPIVLQELYDAEVWNNREALRPSFYCLEIMR